MATSSKNNNPDGSKRSDGVGRDDEDNWKYDEGRIGQLKQGESLALDQFGNVKIVGRVTMIEGRDEPDVTLSVPANTAAIVTSSISVSVSTTTMTTTTATRQPRRGCGKPPVVTARPPTLSLSSQDVRSRDPAQQQRELDAYRQRQRQQPQAQPQRQQQQRNRPTTATATARSHSMQPGRPDPTIDLEETAKSNWCFHCFGWGHWKNECPHGGKKRCQKCCSFGHIVSACKNKRRCYKCGRRGHIGPNCPHPEGDHRCYNCKRMVSDPDHNGRTCTWQYRVDPSDGEED